MNDINEYLAHIKSKGEKEGQASLDHAAEQRTTSFAHQKERSQKEFEEKEAQMHEWINKELHEKISQKETMLQKELSSYRLKLMGETFSEVEKELFRLPQNEVISLVQSAVNTIDIKGEFTVLFGDKTAENINIKEVSAAIAPPPSVTFYFSEETIPNEGGFLLRQGAIEYIYLYGDILETMKQSSGSEVILQLFR